MSAPAEVETSRLLLRRWRVSDRAPFAALNADPVVMEYFPAPLSRAESDALADRIDSGFDRRGFAPWAVEVRATGRFIGFTGLLPMPEGVPGAGGVEVGWRLAREAWGRGYATEAAQASVAVAFDPLGLGLGELNSITAVGNLRSRAVMERLGMHLADSFEHPRLAEGSPLRPHVRYVLTASDAEGAATGADADGTATPTV
ncbi:GNAT family N-acetyltransferase [Herbiconiux liangxiaofengii]|uniref:GNAT family N-acetyltransferase n=1 Tax=Herbiconiux liangxiaofengii TaxID=3342795 RepID=UPI0035BB776A